MGKIRSQANSEIKQIPLMLGKLLGGIMSVIGFTSTVLVITRKAGPSLEDFLVFVLLGVAGIIVFVLSSRMLDKRLSASISVPLMPNDNMRMNLLSWVFLLVFAAIFLLCTYLLTR